MKKRFIISLLIICWSFNSFSQFTTISIASDFGLQRSFKKEQRYTTAGHTVQIHWHLSSRNGLYGWFSYYGTGKFNNDLTAIARASQTTPQQINYNNRAEMRLKHLSLGWKHYLKGRFDADEGWNLYGYAGLGLLLGRISNAHSPAVDTADYDLPVLQGSAKFKRLTLDLGAGWEIPVGAAIFVYAEGRVWVPTTDYPSRHLFVNRRAPLVGIATAGVRILFD